MFYELNTKMKSMTKTYYFMFYCVQAKKTLISLTTAIIEENIYGIGQSLVAFTTVIKT